MKDLDKELEKVLDENINYGYKYQMSDYAFSKDEEREYYLRGREEVTEAIAQIKTVILEALKAEMPKETKVEGNVHYDASAAYNAGINHGVSDCLEVCNRLLGDEDAKG